ncbi:MAG: trigger factor [Solirubrobacterales bacterium]
MPEVTATLTELPESRVRVEAQVAPDEVARRVDQAARSLGRDMKMAGFRKGKVPPDLIIQRLGRETVLDEAVRGSIGSWYGEAVDGLRLHTIGQPELEVGKLPDSGEPLDFSFEIGVRPEARLGSYKGLKVARREPQAAPEAVDEQIEELRNRMASLETVEEPAAEGDFVLMDFKGSIDGELFEGGEGSGQLVELGSGRLIPGFEEQLVGAAAGDERTVSVSFPDDYGAEHLAGKDASFEVKVSEVRRQELPELDDDFAESAAGFETLEERKADVAARLLEADREQAEAEFQEAVLDAAVDGSKVEVPDALVEARARELLDRMLHRLSHQGISREMYLQISGQSEEELVAESAEEARKTLQREAVLAAVVEAEGIEPSDGDILDALQGPALQEKMSPQKLRKRLEKAGRLDDLKDDLAQRAALDFLVENAVATA